MLGTSTRRDPGTALSHSIDVFGGERRAGLLFDFLSWRPWVGSIVKGTQVALDDDESDREAGERDGAEHRNGRGVGNISDEEARHACARHNGGEDRGRDDEHEHRCPKDPVLLAKGDRAAHANMHKGDTGHDEEAGLADGEGKPQAGRGARVGRRLVTPCTTHRLGDGLPNKYRERENITEGQPYVTFVSRRQGAEIGEAELRLMGNVSVRVTADHRDGDIREERVCSGGAEVR